MWSTGLNGKCFIATNKIYAINQYPFFNKNKIKNEIKLIKI